MIAAIVALGACTKAGSVGPAGANGTNGTDGKNGAANVKSRVIPITFNDWTAISATSGYGFDATLNATEITTDIASKGVVLCYLSPINAAETWLAMPTPGFGSNFTFFFNYGYSTGSLGISLRSSVAISKPTSAYYVRLVTIAPTAVKTDIDNTNYLAVRCAYNLDKVEADQRKAEEDKAVGGN